MENKFKIKLTWEDISCKTYDALKTQFFNEKIKLQRRKDEPENRYMCYYNLDILQWDFESGFVHKTTKKYYPLYNTKEQWLENIQEILNDELKQYIE